MASEALESMRRKMADLAEQARKAAAELHNVHSSGKAAQQGQGQPGTINRQGVAGAAGTGSPATGGYAPGYGPRTQATPGYASTAGLMLGMDALNFALFQQKGHLLPGPSLGMIKKEASIYINTGIGGLVPMSGVNIDKITGEVKTFAGYGDYRHGRSEVFHHLPDTVRRGGILGLLVGPPIDETDEMFNQEHAWWVKRSGGELTGTGTWRRQPWRWANVNTQLATRPIQKVFNKPGVKAGLGIAAAIGAEVSAIAWEEIEHADQMASISNMRNSGLKSQATLAAQKGRREFYLDNVGAAAGATVLWGAKLAGMAGASEAAIAAIPIAGWAAAATFAVYRGAKFVIDWHNQNTLNEAQAADIFRMYHLGDLNKPAEARAKDWLDNAKSMFPEAKMDELESALQASLPEAAEGFRLLELGENGRAFNGAYTGKSAYDMLREADERLPGISPNWQNPIGVYEMFEAGRLARRNYARAMTVRPSLRIGD